MLTLAHKVIVIVGGTTGLGLSAARACVRAGARCLLIGRNPESLAGALGELGSAALGLAGDASSPEVSVRGIQMALDAWGGFDGLYHVAGGSGRKFGDGPLHEITDEGIDYTLDLNLKSVIYSNRAAVQQFLARKTAGAILNMASVLGFSPAPKHFATHAYAAAKAGIIGFSKSAAACYAPHDIRVNVLAPALVDTPMARRAVNNDEISRYIRGKQPLDGGRAGLPEDLDAATVWLLSDQSRFVTGQVLAIDGGWCVSEGPS